MYQHAIVHLLQAVCLPAQHKKLLKAKVEGSTDGPSALFEPEPELRAELNMPKALIKPDASCVVTLVMENSSFELTQLKKGRILGQLYPANILSDQDPTRHYRTHERRWSQSQNGLHPFMPNNRY